MRVTQEGMVHNALLRLEERLRQTAKASERLSSGKVVQRPSDDPAGMNRALALRAQQRSLEQEGRNAGDGLTWLQITDGKLQTTMTRMHRVRDLLVSGASAADPGARDAIATELETIRDELVNVANSRIDGRPLFSGTSSNDAVAWDPVAQAWQYQGNTGPESVIERRVSEQDRVAINVTAAEAFGFGGGGDNLFAQLDTAIARLRSGDQAGTSASIGDMDTAMSRISRQLSVVGAATNRVDSAMVRNSEELLAVRGELAKVEDVDLAQAVMELQTQEVAYQATLAALSRVLQPSLVNFLR